MKPIDTFYIFGRPFSPIYAWLMRIRSILYKHGVLKTEQLPVPVISIGNLTMGGTGKTPMVRCICCLLQEKGLRPAIISRGYGGTENKAVNIVSDGTSLQLSAKEAGDEPFMLASSLPTIPVLTGAKRLYPCRYAIDNFRCNVLILDDGFQHMAVHRDLNIVLFTAGTIANQLRVFPGGELREPFTALKRADAFVLTGVDNETQHQLKQLQSFFNEHWPLVPVFSTHNSIEGVFDSQGNPIDESAASLNYMAFSGIAHPERFTSSLQQMQLSVPDKLFLDDHARYSKKVLRKIENQAKRCGANALITTEKDIGKVQHIPHKLPIHYLKIKTVPDNSLHELVLNFPAIKVLLD